MRALLAFAALAGCIGGAAAQDAACSGFKWPLGREISALARADLPTVVNGSPLPGLADPVTVKLAPQDGVSYPVAPAHKPKHAPAYGGTFAMPPMATRDTYQVTLSGDAWVDVVQDGKALHQVGFTGRSGCPSVHKSVRFILAPGPATVEISDAETDSLKLEVAPKQP